MNHWGRYCWVGMGIALATATATAQVAVPPPAGASSGLQPAVAGVSMLEIKGRIGLRHEGDGVRLDAATLRALPQKQIKTHLPWYDGIQTFSGPTLQSVLERVQAKGESLRLVALNDYSVDIPLTDIARYQPILAHQLNGKPLTVRDKGPWFLVYPFDKHPEIKNDLYYGRSIWQVTAILVR